VHRRAEDEF